MINLKIFLVPAVFSILIFLDLSCRRVTNSLIVNNTPKIYEYFEVDTKPVIIHKEDPVYPQEALTDSIEGIVVVSVIVKPDSSADVDNVYKSVNAALDSAAVETARLYRFIPATFKGKAVYCSMKLPVQFKL
ncbi:MAG: energy transducer TonB [Calditrichaceae bacterium]